MTRAAAGVLEVCYTGSGCAAVTGFTTDEGSIGLSECGGIDLIGCSGIQTRVNEGSIEVCYTGESCLQIVNDIECPRTLNITGSFCDADMISVDAEGDELNIGIVITKDMIESCLDICCLDYLDHDMVVVINF